MDRWLLRLSRRISWVGVFVSVAAIWLTGCQSHAPLVRAASASYVASIEPIEAQGEHDGFQGTLVFSPRILAERTLCRHVVAHEIGHALGANHVSAPAIMAASHGLGEAPIESLTREEIAAARRSVGRTVYVRLPKDAPPLFVESAEWAAHLWNGTLGADVVRLVH